jgi:hypothetical protein
MYHKTLFVGGGGAAVWGSTHLHEGATHLGEHTTGLTHFVREAFVVFPGEGTSFWILNVLALIVGINTIIYALVAMWKLRPRRQQPLIDAKWENHAPDSESLPSPTQ